MIWTPSFGGADPARASPAKPALRVRVDARTSCKCEVAPRPDGRHDPSLTPQSCSIARPTNASAVTTPRDGMRASCADALTLHGLGHGRVWNRTSPRGVRDD